MNTPIMEPEDEVRDLLEQLEQTWVEASRYHCLLVTVLDAGRPHSDWKHDCPKCAAWLAVRKELRGE